MAPHTHKGGDLRSVRSLISPGRVASVAGAQLDEAEVKLLAFWPFKSLRTRYLARATANHHERVYRRLIHR